jgi:hypothetical protein
MNTQPVNAWTKGTARVRLWEGAADVKALVNWPLAVHKAPDGKPGWQVTSTTTGLAIVFVRTRKAALLCAEALLPYRESLSLPTAAAINAMLPRWVRRWARQCNIENTFVPPTSV